MGLCLCVYLLLLFRFVRQHWSQKLRRSDFLKKDFKFKLGEKELIILWTTGKTAHIMCL